MQAKACWFSYVEYHQCMSGLSGDADAEKKCHVFKRNYTHMCPAAWVEKFDAQREEGAFVGPNFVNKHQHQAQSHH
jgi:cytochrome c oxidase subunit 6b